MCATSSTHPSEISSCSKQDDRWPTMACRPFFIAAILFMLFAGAAWGTLMMLKFAFTLDYSEFSIHQLNAHGRAMISGFVNLFIIGFAYQAFGGMIGHPVSTKRGRIIVFSLLVSGTILAIVGQLRWPNPGAWTLTLIGDLLELIGVLGFALQLTIAFRHGGTKIQPFLGFIFAAVMFMVVQSIGGLLLNTKTLAAEFPNEIVYYVSTYQPSLRNVQFHGTILLMILGVGHRLLPSFYDIPRASNRTAWLALVICTLSVLTEASLFMLMRLTDNPRLGAGMLIAWIGLLIGALMIVGRWRLWRPLRDRLGRSDRMEKFVRASFAWLAIAWILLVALPLWSKLVANTYFSHAFYGAGRQAYTFGFVTMIIFAFSLRIVPTVNGIVPTRLRSLNEVFWLANVGCALHVILQTASDLWPMSLRALPIAGILEASAIALWSAHMFWCMWQGRPRLQPSDDPARSVSLRVVNT